MVVDEVVELVELVGGTVLAAIPDSGSCLFWSKETEELEAGFNLVVAVGVVKLYEQSSHPVSKYIYQWSGSSWELWGEAIPSEKKSSELRLREDVLESSKEKQ